MQLSKLLDRWFSHPFVSFLIIIFWLMLAHSLDASDLLMAVVLGLVIPRLVRPFITRTPHIHWKPAIKLCFVVLWDIINSNFRFSKLVLGSPKKLHPKWYRVPLETEHEQVNSLLAMIITTTPGTVSAGIDQERGDILVHSLSTENTESDVQDIKQRYEAPLMEIFDVKSKSEDNA